VVRTRTEVYTVKSTVEEKMLKISDDSANTKARTTNPMMHVTTLVHYGVIAFVIRSTFQGFYSCTLIQPLAMISPKLLIQKTR